MKKIINKKVLLITNIPTPYRIPLFNCIYSKLKSENIDFLVVFANKTYPRRKWQIDLDTIEFNYYFLNSEFISLSSEKSIFTYKGINKLISQFNPDVVISNGFTLSTIRIIIQRIFFYNYKLIIWSGAIERYKQPIGMLREILRKFIVKRVDRFIVYGSRAKDYIVSLGGNRDKIDISYNTIDSFSFKYMDSIKTFNEKTKILFVGHLTKGKNIESLLPVLKKISIKYPLEFILVGDGPERRNLKDLSEKLGISKIVKFEGFKQQSELSKYYLDADIFVFPSNYDIWGLVVIEAMVHSLVCITSIHSGVSDDLIENGQTGYAIDFSNKEEVEKIIIDLINNKEKIKLIGRKAKDNVDLNFSIKNSSNQFIKAIKSEL